MKVKIAHKDITRATMAIARASIANVASLAKQTIIAKLKMVSVRGRKRSVLRNTKTISVSVQMRSADVAAQISSLTLPLPFLIRESW